MKYRILIAILSLVFFASCKTRNILMESKKEQKISVTKLDSTFFYNPNYQYKIKKDDKISISVWGEDELSVGSSFGIYNSNEIYGKWLKVDAIGNIEIPKLGTQNVLGKTLIDIKTMLKERHKKWLVNPIVDVKILNKEITVLGEVISPQVLTVEKDQSSLLEIIARCKGLDEYARKKYIKVLRQDGENVIVANIDITESGNILRKNIQLHPGDVVVVPSKNSKVFDKRISVIIPFTTTISAASILLGLF